jgi:peptidoglycan/xylan/chitin deacetylase (PgdA/CDA1 family)
MNRVTSSARLIKRLERKLADLGIYNPASGARGVKILLYHGVVPKFDPSFRSRFIGVEDFRRHLVNYKKNYHVISLEDAFANRLKPGKMNLVITFDDGYRNNFLYAAPLLRELALPASFFVTGMNSFNPGILWADLLDLYERFNDGSLEVEGELFIKNRNGKYVSSHDGETLNRKIKAAGNLSYKKRFYEACLRGNVAFLHNPDWEDYYRLMDDVEIAALAGEDLFTIGSHGYYHNNLGNIPIGDALEEVEQSVAYLSSICAKPVNSIAFPDGSYGRELPKALMEKGINMQLACAFLFKEDSQQSWLKDRHEISWFESSMGIFNYELVKG